MLVAFSPQQSTQFSVDTERHVHVKMHINSWEKLNHFQLSQKKTTAYEERFPIQFPTPTCIPIVSTAGPWQLGGKTVEEVEDGPGKDHDVIHVEMSFDHLCCVADT